MARKGTLHTDGKERAMTRCIICGDELTERNQGFVAELLDSTERLRLSERQRQVCVMCKHDLLLAGILTVL